MRASGSTPARPGGTINGTLQSNGPTWVAGTTFTPPNTAPVVDSVVIDQASPQTNDTLTATVTSHDAESNPVTYAYQWTKNGTDIAGATSSTLDLSVAGNGDKGDLIRLRVTASDASLTSAPLTSAARTVQNSTPSATVSLDDHLPGTNATLTATATTDDADSDAVTLTYVWTVEGVVRQTTSATTALTDTFDLSAPNNGGNGDEVVVTVTPNDGTQDGLPVADTANVGNAVPVVDSVAIDQATPLTDDVLSATVTSHDGDDDPLTTSYQWTKNGTDIAGATDATLDLSVAGNGDKGDVIRVRVTVDDGNEPLGTAHLGAGHDPQHRADGDGGAGRRLAGHERHAHRHRDGRGCRRRHRHVHLPVDRGRRRAADHRHDGHDRHVRPVGRRQRRRRPGRGRHGHAERRHRQRLGGRGHGHGRQLDAGRGLRRDRPGQPADRRRPVGHRDLARRRRRHR